MKTNSTCHSKHLLIIDFICFIEIFARLNWQYIFFFFVIYFYFNAKTLFKNTNYKNNLNNNLKNHIN